MSLMSDSSTSSHFFNFLDKNDVSDEWEDFKVSLNNKCGSWMTRLVRTGYTTLLTDRTTLWKRRSVGNGRQVNATKARNVASDILQRYEVLMSQRKSVTCNLNWKEVRDEVERNREVSSRTNEVSALENLDPDQINNLAEILEDLGKKRREERLSIEEWGESTDDEMDEEIETNFAIPRYRNVMDTAKAIEQFVVLESNLVTCGAGLEIRRILPGFDLCQVILQLPADYSRKKIEDFLLMRRLRKCDFHILRVERGRGMQKATIVMDVRLGKAMITKSSGGFEVCPGGILATGKMQENKPVLTLIWDVDAVNEKDSARALAVLYDALGDSQGVLMETCYILTPDTGSSADKVTLAVEFNSWPDAFKAAREIKEKGSKIPSLTCTLPIPYQYSIQISLAQYLAQSKQWLALTNTKDKDKAGIDITPGKRVVTIQIQGNDRISLGAARVRIEKLAGGEVLEGKYWHYSFASSADSQIFLQQVMDQTKVHLRSDPDIQALWVYGEPDNVDQARKIVRDEAHRRGQIMTRTSLSDASTEFFVRNGFGKLQELVGEDNVDLKMTSKWSAITMRGGEEATHHLQRLLAESLIDNALIKLRFRAEAATCPICLSEVAFPERLGCGHAYCSGCLIHFFTAAEESKSFPIVCMGNEAKCKVPISLPFIRRFLPHQSFKRLIEASFASYLERNPTEFRYCKTPDCRQTYRRQTSRPVVLNCPSCLAKTCSSCGEDHEKLTCEEYRRQRDPEEQERLNSQLASKNGYKRCPRCAIWVEKIGGCNHMSCKCGAHICWTCLGIFDTSTIYNHMRAAHGH